MDACINPILALFFLIYAGSLMAQDSFLYLVVNRDTELSDDNSFYEGTVYNETGRPCECVSTKVDTTRVDLNNETCSSGNPLDFCSKIYFEGDGVYNISVSFTNDTSDGTYTCETLLSTMEKIRERLRVFELLMARTLVCVYLQSCDNKTRCLKAYTNWLCATQLKFYNNTSSQMKPCYGVCKEVLRNCPYYLPLGIIYNMTNTSTNRTTFESNYVYGGYPAFACPDSKTYFNITNSTYASRDCFGPP